MFQRHSALGSEVLQYGLPYFSNFVNTESARQYIAIFLKACWLVWFYLFSFSCSPAVVSYSEAVKLQAIVPIMEPEEWGAQRRAGFSAPCHEAAPALRLCSELCTGSHKQKSALNPGCWLLQADKNWEKSEGNQPPIPPNPQVDSQCNKRLQHSDYHAVIFHTAWAQGDKL